MRLPTTLRRLADHCGIQTSFVDSSRARREASADTVRALLKIWGVPAGSDGEAEASLAALKELEQQQCMPPVVVQWDDKPARIKLSRSVPRAEVRITPREVDAVTHRRTVEASARDSHLLLPAMPAGYYSVELEVDGARCESLLISAPSKAYAERGMREWGVFLPMYAAWRSEPNSWSAGTFSDFSALGDKIAALGGGVISTLPLTAALLDRWKSEPSPYSPASRLFWNEFFVDVTAAPEFAGSESAAKLIKSKPFASKLAGLRAARHVDYDSEMALKRQVIERMASDFFHRRPDRWSSFQAFLAARPELERYAAFRAVCEDRQASWHSWPERLKAGDLHPQDYSEPAKQYHLYAQWLAQQQVDQLGSSRGTPSILSGTSGRRAKLYLDLPLGVNPDGYDVWRERERFAMGASVGAPPDAFFTLGQDWGFPPLHPERIRMDGYRYVIDYLRFQMSHTSMLRLDHVMGLHRLWWVPHGATAAQGAYVRYRDDELYAILCLESHRHQTTLVGENLGTVPPQVNRALKRHGIRTMYVVQYEAGEDAKQPLCEPPRECVASINTHDMPAWAAHWAGADIADRRDLGLLDATEVKAEARRRARVRRALETFLKKKGYLKGKADAASVLGGLLRFLAASKAELVLVNLEDLWLEAQPQNTPGTSAERVNWRRKTSRAFDEMLSLEEIRSLLTALKR